MSNINYSERNGGVGGRVVGGRKGPRQAAPGRLTTSAAGARPRSTVTALRGRDCDAITPTLNLAVLDTPSRLEKMTGLLTASELSPLIGVGRTELYEMAAEGRIPSYRIGTMVRFDPVEVARWLRDRQIGMKRAA